MQAWDLAIVGGGHNGLVTAAYAARGGLRTIVLEARDRVGGACVTEEPWPGFKVSTAAYVVSLFRPEIVRDLDLARHGYVVLPRSPSSFTPLPDGRSLLLGPDPALNRREIARLSARDAERFPAYEAMLDRIARVVEPTLLETPPDPFSRRPRDLLRLARLGWSLLRLGPDGPRAIELLVGAARPVLDRWFESDALKATLATDAIIGALASPSTPGTAYVLFHHVMGEVNGVRGVWGYVRGGMGALSEALAAVARAAGAEIRTGAPVARIRVREGKADGVILADGSELDARRVASSADARRTLLDLAGPAHLPEGVADAIRALDFSSASLKVNLALSELPSFGALPGHAPGPQHRGTIHVAPSLDYLERAFADAARGRPSEEPVIECTIPSVVDPTVAPPGRHVMSMFVQYAPYRLAEGTWDARKEAFADRCVELVDRVAPGFPASVLHREVLSPLDLERRFGLTGGNIFQGAMTPQQLFFLRPLPGYADYRTPVRDLYLCGAATHPGGGVMGACGRNAAREILRDARRGWPERRGHAR
ncbi:phytoene desaturase family protein [Anaeromyxobacter oryzae]|uniref:Pyridine nucleotide-disulfide oxidoreductase domain-containing protein 2 n=1 Tax=Anaeromyxobacter oryzae TaxID=2918170 RepID=A0ABM7WNR7_9BACT|nr:NAD(P)/FAD-dependent oxidoreductase [Anaeromyxobacter oryzae]BDG01107.1 FAD-dependent oxidoreductase [Anaeromyxobacter oryzae]